MYKHILLPTDGSDRSMRAIVAGIQLAKTLNAKVTGLYSSEPSYIPGADQASTPLAEAALADVTQRATEAGVACACVSLLAPSPQEGIVKFAQENDCDLIIMATHGRSKVGKFFLGSVAASVLAECEIPVLLCR